MALLPYALWYWQGPNPHYVYFQTYIPVVYWACGYTSFCVGAKIVKRRHPTQRMLLPSLRFSRLINFACAVSGMLLLQIVGATLLYKDVPLLAFISGRMNIQDILSINSESGGFGQLGMLFLTIQLLNGVILLMMLKAIEIRTRITLLLVIGTVLSAFASTMAGTRQGFVMTVFYLTCGLTLRYGDPIRAFWVVLGARVSPRPILRLLTFTAAILAFFWFMGEIVELRNNGEYTTSGISEVQEYLETPLINFEAQCAQAGYGPYQWNLLDLGKNLLPNRLIASWSTLFNPAPLKPEPTAPNGFFGPLQWGVGLSGAVAFCLLCGAGCRLLYDHAVRNLLALLLYPLVGWALLTASAYQHFLNLTYVPGPAILLSGLCAVLGALRLRFPRAAPEVGPTRQDAPQRTVPG